MLDITLTTAFVPGTNLKNQVSGGNWTFLLPSLEIEQIVCIGAPALTTLSTLSRVARRVTIICANARQTQKINEASHGLGLSNVQALVEQTDVLLAAEGSADLLLIAGGNAIAHLHGDPERLAQIRQLLRPEGVIYLEYGGLFEWLAGRKPLNGLAHEFGAPQRFWLTPANGEMRTAVPVDDEATILHFLRHSLYSPSIRLRGFERAERVLSRHPLIRFVTRRYGVLLRSAPACPADAPPHYLRSIAQAAGVELSAHRWGLAALGEYRSRKVLCYLFDRASGLPQYIVKMTRDPALNPRLENEHRALTLLREKRIGDRNTLPQIAFFGHHGGLAIVGETVIDGMPFRQRTRATADCPYARSAIDWLLELGAATADPHAATPREVAAALETLYRRFLAIYRLDPVHRDFLVGQIAAISQSRAAFPLVFQHGDPGTWNVLVTKEGRAAFLDWEAAEPQGMPLWDLFYFLRSYAVTVARACGIRDGLAGFARHFLEESALSSLIVEVIAQYCERTGLSRGLVEPMFYTCWMHRALKEATRLAPDRLENGHYVRLLQLCIGRRGAPTLRRIFS